MLPGQPLKPDTPYSLAEVCISLAISFNSISIPMHCTLLDKRQHALCEKVVLTAFSAPERGVVLPNTPASFGSTKPTAKLAATAPNIVTALNQAQNLFNSIYSPNCTSCKGIVSGTYKSIEGEAQGRYRALCWGVSDFQCKEKEN